MSYQHPLAIYPHRPLSDREFSAALADIQVDPDKRKDNAAHQNALEAFICHFVALILDFLINTKRMKPFPSHDTLSIAVIGLCEAVIEAVATGIELTAELVTNSINRLLSRDKRSDDKYKRSTKPGPRHKPQIDEPYLTEREKSERDTRQAVKLLPATEAADDDTAQVICDLDFKESRSKLSPESNEIVERLLSGATHKEIIAENPERWGRIAGEIDSRLYSRLLGKEFANDSI